MYSPIDLEESRIKGYTVRDESLAFSEQFDQFMKFDFRIGYRMEKKELLRRLNWTFRI